MEAFPAGKVLHREVIDCMVESIRICTGFITSMQQRNRYPKIHYPIFRLDLVIQGMHSAHIHGAGQAVGRV